MAQRAVFQLAVAAAAVLLLAGCAQVPAPSADLGSSTSPNAFALLGATPATLSSEFGPPDLRRVDGTAQVWLYHSPVCGLNLILYPDRNGTPRVALAVPNNGDAASCTASLRRDVTDAALAHSATSSSS